MRNSHDELSSLIGQVYDCAVQPELWPQTLASIKKALNLAVLQVVSVDGHHLRQGQAVQTLAFKTLFEHNWVNDFARYFNKIPGGQDWFANRYLDVPVSQMQLVSEGRVQDSEFYKEIGFSRGSAGYYAQCTWSSVTI